MKENEEKLGSVSEQKEKIRARYRGLDMDELDVIPATPTENFYEDKKEKRVAVYARVSTDDPRQTSSYELQKNHYTDVINRHEGWTLIDIYADEGISGTSLQHRDSFIRMINDCHEGKLDLIVTKSVSRFARNVLDCIGYVRELAALKPPIGVFFETENIYTLNSNSEMSLSFISTLAQEESHNKSEIMNSSIEMRFKRGIFLTPPLLGYDRDEDGNLVINEEEAKTVRLVFFMYLYGYTCQQIAETLTKLGRVTKKDNPVWSAGSILQILKNERHCGDVLARKTWTPNYLDHKAKRNNKDRNQYRKRNHHEAIISRDDFIAVQRLISNAKYGNKGILPELHVVTEGVLRGFTSVNPRWGGFSVDDYFHASESVYDAQIELPSDDFEIKTHDGDFDFRGFEIARSQFFDTIHRSCVTFSITEVLFSTDCVRKFDKIMLVEMLIHPTQHMFAVRPSTTENRNAVKWAKSVNGILISRGISGTAFLKVIYDMLGWNYECRYRIRGVKKQKGDEVILLFDLSETEIFIPTGRLENGSDNEKPDQNPSSYIGTSGKSVRAYPAEWAFGFGNNYYRHAQAAELASFDEHSDWKTAASTSPFVEEDALQVTSNDEIKSNIQQIISDMKQEG